MTAPHLPDHLIFRPGRDTDGAGMSALIAQIFADYENCPFVPEEFPELAAPATHYGQKKRGQLWVIEDAQTDAAPHILGSIAITPTFKPGVAELFKVYLSHDLRGRGIAATLLNEALEWAQASGSHTVVLWTDTRFLAGHRFYEKHGFVRMPGIRALHDAASTFEFGYTLSLSNPVHP